MKNFVFLFYYEMKKLLCRPLSWVVLALLAAASFYVSYNYYLGTIVYDLSTEKETEYVTVPYRQWAIRTHENGVSLNGRLIDDSFLRELETSLPYLEGERLRLWCYESNSPFCTFFDNVNGFYNFPRDSSAAEFYSLRHSLVEQLWEHSELSDGEKTYWEKKEQALSKPFSYQDPWPGAHDWFEGLRQILLLFPLAAAVCLCPSFSEDHKRQTEPLIFSSKNSRSSLFLARLSAGLFTGMLSAVILLAAYTAGACLIYGTGGLDAPMQMIEITLSNPVSVGGMMRSLVFLLVCHAAVWSALTMLVSAWSRSAVAALAIPFFLSWFSLRMRPPVTRLTALLPQYMICEYSFRDLWLNRIFGVYLDGLQTFLLLCAFCVCSVLDAASLKGGITFPYKDDSGNEREIFLRDEDIAARCQKDIPKLNSLLMDDAFFAALRENVPDLEPMNLNVFFIRKTPPGRKSTRWWAA